MRIILRKLREARQRDEGFTLIELLIVILILGVLAGIAIFASGPFREKAAIACEDANTEIAIIHDAAVDAGVTGELYAQGPGDCAGGSGAGTTPVSFTAALVPGGTWTGTDGATTTATAGNLLVAVTGHRTNAPPFLDGTAGDTAGADALPAVAGWTAQGFAFIKDATAGNRRGISVYTRIAAGNDSFSIDWASGTETVFVAEFSRTGDDPDWTNTAAGFAYTEDDADAPGSPYLLNAATAAADGSYLQIAGFVGRGGPSTGTLGLTPAINSAGSSVSLWLEFTNVTGAGSYGASLTWSGWAEANEGSGLVLLMR